VTWYYADGGRQVGPIEESALDDLVRSGVVRDDTLVWQEGMPNWQPHVAVRAPKPAVPMPGQVVPDTAFCSECGKPFPSAQLVAIGSASVCAQCKPVFMQRIREGGQSIGVMRYAGFWIRFVARVLDGVILGVVLAIINIPVQMMVGLGSMRDPGAMMAVGFGLLGVMVLVDFALGFAYEVYFVATRGATPGKMILGLKIIRPDGSALSVGQAVGRYFAYVLDFFTLYIGFIIAGFDEQKRALHDRICDTRVIHVK
jgi:uncharacterized RDD family membrane protein YckC